MSKYRVIVEMVIEASSAEVARELACEENPYAEYQYVSDIEVVLEVAKLPNR